MLTAPQAQAQPMGFTMPVLTPDLAAAIVDAQANVEAARKDRHSPGEDGYDYASAEEIIATAKPALRSAGLAVLPLTYSLEATAPTSERGMGGLDVVRCLRLLHRSGAYVEWMVRWPVHLHGKAKDKAVAGALTSMLGYVLRDLLQIPRGLKGEEGMDERRDDSEERRERKAPERTGETVVCGERPSWMRREKGPARAELPADAPMSEVLGLAPGDGLPATSQTREAAEDGTASPAPGSLLGAAHTDDPPMAAKPEQVESSTPAETVSAGAPSNTDAPPAPGPVPPGEAGEASSPTPEEPTSDRPSGEGAPNAADLPIEEVRRRLAEVSTPEQLAALAAIPDEEDDDLPDDDWGEVEERPQLGRPVLARAPAPTTAATLTEAEQRKDRAARWKKRPSHKAKAHDIGTCVECGEQVDPGDLYHRGVEPDPKDPARRLSKRGQPIGVAHALCVEDLAKGIDPRAEEAACAGE